MDDLNTDILSKGKELLKLMMKWKTIDKDIFFGGAVEKYLQVKCPNCSYYKENPSRHYWNNYASHYTACVGRANIAELVACQIGFVNGTVTTTVPINHPNHTNQRDTSNFIITIGKQKSTNMWLKLICLKNLLLNSVKCPIMRESVTYPETKSTKVVTNNRAHVT